MKKKEPQKQSDLKKKRCTKKCVGKKKALKKKEP